MAKQRRSREGTLAEAVQFARINRQWSLRDLAERAGVSAAQISRIESETVSRPAVGTLVGLARALELNPIPLLILAGHISPEEARRRLHSFLADGTELWEAWTQQGTDEDADYVAEMRAILDDPESTAEQVGEVARNLFVTPELEETAWHESLLLVAAEGPGAADLREVAQLWPALTSERRERVMATLRDQVQLSRAEWKDEVAKLTNERSS